VIYCGFVKCTRSHNGAAWAVRNGYTNVYRYPGGIFAWKGAKYPVAHVQ
jgi:rhodanese-related sulfurtransferase